MTHFDVSCDQRLIARALDMITGISNRHYRVVSLSRGHKPTKLSTSILDGDRDRIQLVVIACSSKDYNLELSLDLSVDFVNSTLMGQNGCLVCSLN